jgi:small subunit ribosomal protein S6
VIRINQYEIMLMIHPELEDDRQGEIVERVKTTVEQRGGSWGETAPWGKRKLAYEIGHQTEAWYHVVSFDAPPDALEEATRVLAITDGVMRFMPTLRPSRKTLPDSGEDPPERPDRPERGRGRGRDRDRDRDRD